VDGACYQFLACARLAGDEDAGVQDFLTLWKDADSDIPIYQQAKAEYAKLRANANHAD
jgi:hypothetical protein